MTRPLRYDDSFTSIINEKVHEKFLLLFNVKVQSTAFQQKLNLQRSLIIVSLFDLFMGLVMSLLFFRSIDQSYDSMLFFIENFILIISFCFAFVGLDTATNLKRYNAKIYKNWRIFVTFAFPLVEAANNFQFLHTYNIKYDGFNSLVFTLIYMFINLYFTKIAWSFNIRLQKGHELLIIHGKYLEKMMNDESYKINDLKKYVPPEQSIIKSTVETEMNLFKQTNI
jgi:hypothetical protein